MPGFGSAFRSSRETLLSFRAVREPSHHLAPIAAGQRPFLRRKLRQGAEKESEITIKQIGDDLESELDRKDAATRMEDIALLRFANPYSARRLFDSAPHIPGALCGTLSGNSFVGASCFASREIAQENDRRALLAAHRHDEQAVEKGSH